MQTIIITGAAGFIGCNFARLALTETEHHIVLVDKLTYAGHLANLEDIAGGARITVLQEDIADRAAMEAVYRRYEPSWVINFAAESHVDRSIDDPEPFIRTNTYGTWVLLETARRYLATASPATRAAFRFLHVSTDEVYGSLGAIGRFHEESPYMPNSPYAASKAAADHFVRAYWHTYRVPTLLTNCSNNYGPFQFPEKLIPLTLLNALEGKPIRIYGDGLQVRDWLYVEDHCRALLQVIEKGTVGEHYNIGGDAERTNRAIVEELCRQLEERVPAHANPALQRQGIRSYLDLRTFVTDRPGHDRRYAIDPTKVRRTLGWQPAHSFEQALSNTVDWYLAHQDWCTLVLQGRYERERLGLAAAGDGR